MINKNKDIFSALGKYNSATDENYLTEAFVFLLNFLKEEDNSIFLRILNFLCVNKEEFEFNENEAIEITTQISTEYGRPDIKILSHDKLIYIEVKHNSGLGYKQIKRYENALKKSNATYKKVILLTKFAIDINEQEESKPYKHVRWFEIANWFSSFEFDKHTNPVTKYLINSFLNFLEARNMTMQKISWEYVNGFQAFKNLINMLITAAEEKYPKFKKSAGWDFTGVYLDKDTRAFFGLYHTKSLKIVIEVLDKQKKKKIYSESLDLENIYFFCLNKDQQIEKIRTFIKEKFNDIEEALR
jgi:hypothetical protein